MVPQRSMLNNIIMQGIMAIQYFSTQRYELKYIMVGLYALHYKCICNSYYMAYLKEGLCFIQLKKDKILKESDLEWNLQMLDTSMASEIGPNI